MYSLMFPTFWGRKAVPVLFLPLMIRNDLTHSAGSLSTLTARTAKERAPEPAHSRSRARARLLNQEPLGVASFVIDERKEQKHPAEMTLTWNFGTLTISLAAMEAVAASLVAHVRT